VTLAQFCALARAAETTCTVRDPSTIIKNGNTYYIFGTGPGTVEFSSKDRIHWTKLGPAIPHAPSWLAATVPGNRNLVWAPDIHFWGGKYWLYSAYSSWGSRNSGIGLATSTDLVPGHWQEQGLVVNTTEKDNYNDIDPCIFQDKDGNPWLSFGSFWSGIKLVPIDPATGMRKGDAFYSLDNHSEASAITYHGGYYYLLANDGSCCQGSRSTYRIHMGRSQSVTGPYIDKDGRDLLHDGGSVFLSSVNDDGSGRPPDDEVGPGHFGILHDTDGDWVSFHEEWARDKKGATTVNILKLAWDSDGWPRPVLDRGPYSIESFNPTHLSLSLAGAKAAPGARIELRHYEATRDQKWTFEYQGDGFYSLSLAGTHLALTPVANSAIAGAQLELQPFAKKASQLWYFEHNPDGTYTLLNKNGAKANAVDAASCDLTEHTPVQQWTSLGNACQKWQFRLHSSD
jgi:arabinan endo-1,5-alpha-L-arabinosidase